MVMVLVMQHHLENDACVKSLTNTDRAKHKQNGVHMCFVSMCGIPYMRYISCTESHNVYFALLTQNSLFFPCL